MSEAPRIASPYCRNCGRAKHPRHGCVICYAAGYNFKYKNQTADDRKRVKAERKAKADYRKQGGREYRTTRQEREPIKKLRATTGSKLGITEHLRLIQIALGELLLCFEQDRAGDWQLYEDRMAAFQKAAELARDIFQESIKILPVTSQLRADILGRRKS